MPKEKQNFRRGCKNWMQCFSKGPLRVSSIEDYQNMEKLADEYDAVNAVTIVFSEKEIE